MNIIVVLTESQPALLTIDIRCNSHTTLHKNPRQGVFGRYLIFNIKHTAHWEVIRQWKRQLILQNYELENTYQYVTDNNFKTTLVLWKQIWITYSGLYTTIETFWMTRWRKIWQKVEEQISRRGHRAPAVDKVDRLSGVVSMEGVRIGFSLAKSNNLQIWTGDVGNAFYMELPKKKSI